MDVEASDTVDSLKDMIFVKEHIPVHEQCTTFAGRHLEAGRKLTDYNIQRGSTLDLALRLQGGHCQVPCGIFDDPKLVSELKEACSTIRKAVAQLEELSKDLTALNFNQMTRWTKTKEEHSAVIIEKVTEYCLCQRVKPIGDPKTPFKSESDYTEALQAHHKVMLAAVKCKQSVDLSLVSALESAVSDMCKMYQPSAPAPEDVMAVSASNGEAVVGRSKETACGDGCAVS